jgi:hypothetical protein
MSLSDVSLFLFPISINWTMKDIKMKLYHCFRTVFYGRSWYKQKYWRTMWIVVVFAVTCLYNLVESDARITPIDESFVPESVISVMKYYFQVSTF